MIIMEGSKGKQRCVERRWRRVRVKKAINDVAVLVLVLDQTLGSFEVSVNHFLDK
jgi:hypothetical protein